jgi:hypothetical protein
MRFETMHASWDAHTTESLPPRDGIGFRAACQRQCIRRLRPLADEAVNLFLDVDERLFHGGTRICRRAKQSKNSGRRRDKSPMTARVSDARALQRAVNNSSKPAIESNGTCNHWGRSANSLTRFSAKLRFLWALRAMARLHPCRAKSLSRFHRV